MSERARVAAFVRFEILLRKRSISRARAWVFFSEFPLPWIRDVYYGLTLWLFFPHFRNSAEEKWARQTMTIQCVGHVRPQTAECLHQMHHVVVIGAARNDWTSFLIVFVGFVHFFSILFCFHRCVCARRFVTFARTTLARFPLACDIARAIVRLRQCVFVQSRPFRCILHILNRVYKFDLIVFCIPFRAHLTEISILERMWWCMRGVNCEWNEVKCVAFADFMWILFRL